MGATGEFGHSPCWESGQDAPDQSFWPHSQGHWAMSPIIVILPLKQKAAWDLKAKDVLLCFFPKMTECISRSTKKGATGKRGENSV